MEQNTKPEKRIQYAMLSKENSLNICYRKFRFYNRAENYATCVVVLKIRYPTISKSWTANWQRLIPFFAYPADIRRIIYTTNAIESLNNSLKNIMKKWAMPVRNWGNALNQFAVLYDDRMSVS